MKRLTVAAVEQMVSAIFVTEDSTTTEDIKLALRAQGYYAEQDDVANAMYTLWEGHGWEYTFNGTYRTYYRDLNTALSNITRSDLLSGTIQEMSTALFNAIEVKYLGKVAKTLEIVTEPQPGDHVVFGSGTNPTVFVRGAESYMEAASFYAGKLGIDESVITVRTI